MSTRAIGAAGARARLSTWSTWSAPIGAGGILAFDSVCAEGVEAEVLQDESGGLRLPGFVLAPPAEAPPGAGGPGAPAGAAGGPPADLPFVSVSEFSVAYLRSP